MPETKQRDRLWRYAKQGHLEIAAPQKPGLFPIDTAFPKSEYGCRELTEEKSVRRHGCALSRAHNPDKTAPIDSQYPQRQALAIPWRDENPIDRFGRMVYNLHRDEYYAKIVFGDTVRFGRNPTS